MNLDAETRPILERRPLGGMGEGGYFNLFFLDLSIRSVTMTLLALGIPK